MKVSVDTKILQNELMEHPEIFFKKHGDFSPSFQ
jgi:hypothetical protein